MVALKFQSCPAVCGLYRHIKAQWEPVLPWPSHSWHFVALCPGTEVTTGSSSFQPAAITSPANSPTYSPHLHRQFPPLKCQWINEHAGDLVRELGSVLHIVLGRQLVWDHRSLGTACSRCPGSEGHCHLLGGYLLAHVFARGREDVLLSPHDKALVLFRL